MLVLPRVTAPASASLATTVASYGALKLSSIFEPQLVRTPWVQNRSLWAIGAPSRAPLSPLARRASAARACSGQVFGDADEAVELRIELGDTRQQAPVSSSEENFYRRVRGRSRPESIDAWQALSLIDDFRNQVQAVFDRWCDGLVSLAMIGLGHDVGAQALAGFQRVGQRLDTVGIDGLHFVDQPENAVEGGSDVWKIGFIQAQAGQMSDFFHVGAF
jgi:hypothetical protein